MAWGHNGNGETNVPGDLSDVVAIAAGSFNTVALKDDGSVVAWGNNEFGQLGVPSALTDAVAVAAGWAHIVAAKADGSVVAWGENEFGQTNVPDGLSDVITVAAGWGHTVALKDDGSVVAWGRNDEGQTSVPSDLTDVVAVAAGWAHTVALKDDGTVLAWGGNEQGQAAVPTGLSDAVAVAAGQRHSVALKGDGTIVVWGSNEYGQANIPLGLSNVFGVAAGGENTVALVGPPASLSLDPGRHDAPAAGGNFDFDATASGDWSWGLEGGAGWVTTSEAAEQSGDQAFSYSVARNQSVSPRSATIILTSGTLTATHAIHQAGAAPVLPRVTIRGPRTVRTTKPRATLRGTALDANGDLAWVRFRDMRPKGALARRPRLGQLEGPGRVGAEAG